MSPRKVSAQITELRGNTHRVDLSKQDVLPPPIAPTPPSWLSRRGRGVWEYLAPELEQTALLTRRDREAFGQACETAALAQELMLAMRDDTNNYVELVTRKDGKKPPELVAFIMVSKAFDRWAKHFGLTPQTRIGLMVGTGTGVSKGDDIDDDYVNYSG